MSETEIRELTDQASDGIHPAFYRLWEYYYPAGEEYLVNYLKCDPDDVHDIISDKSRSVWRGIQNQKIDSFQNYYKRTLRNAAYEYHKKKGKFVKIDFLASKEGYTDEPLIDSELEEEKGELIKIVLQKLKRMKNCYEIVKAFYLNGWDLEMIASELNFKNTDSVKNRKATCLKHVRQKITDPNG